MLVSIDDGKTYRKVEGVRVTVNADSEPEGRLHFNFTDKLLVIDLAKADKIVGTSIATYEEISSAHS